MNEPWFVGLSLDLMEFLGQKPGKEVQNLSGARNFM